MRIPNIQAVISIIFAFCCSVFIIFPSFEGKNIAIKIIKLIIEYTIKRVRKILFLISTPLIFKKRIKIIVIHQSIYTHIGNHTSLHLLTKSDKKGIPTIRVAKLVRPEKILTRQKIDISIISAPSPTNTLNNQNHQNSDLVAFPVKLKIFIYAFCIVSQKLIPLFLFLFFLKNSPQCLHFIAFAEIISLQNGQ